LIKEMMRFVVILGLVTALSAGALALVNQITDPVIQTRGREALAAAVTLVLPGSEGGLILTHDQNGETGYFAGFRNPDTTDLIGYAFRSSSQGYSSTIQTLVGVDSSGSILAIHVLSQQETPGLGTRCQEIRRGETEPWWQAQFKGKRISEVAVDKDNGIIQSITGATITSRAITDGIRKQVHGLLPRWNTEAKGQASRPNRSGS
jgi:electron transport complex protein RnfG